MYDLLDCVGINAGDWIFSIVHRSTNELSVMVPSTPADFSYLGLDDWSKLSKVGDSVIVTDDDGDEHCITRIN